MSINNLLRRKKYLPFLVKKPRVFLRLMLNHYYKIVGKKIIRKVEYAVTFDCQCNCPQCSSVYMEKNQPKLNYEQIKNISGQIEKLGALQLNFTGGEPLIEDNLLNIINIFDTRKFLVTLSTNGLLLNKQNIRELRDAGVDIIKISMDSPREEEHDLSRGVQGSYKNILNVLNIIKGIPGILGHISAIATHEILNSSRMYELINIAEKYKVTLGLTVPSLAGKWSNNEEKLLSNGDKDRLTEVSDHWLVIRDTHIGYFGKSYCPAGHEQIYISCYGDIIPCPLIQISFGNIKRENIRSIHNRIINSEIFKKRVKICLAGEDKEFIHRYLVPLQGNRFLPIYYLNHPFNKDNS